MNIQAVGWYAVRCLFQLQVSAEPATYEERVTLWQAVDAEEAITLAEQEAAHYIDGMDSAYLGLAQVYTLFDNPGHGAEIFSLIRRSELDPSTYLDTFFDTGEENQQTLSS